MKASDRLLAASAFAVLVTLCALPDSSYADDAWVFKETRDPDGRSVAVLAKAIPIPHVIFISRNGAEPSIESRLIASRRADDPKDLELDVGEAGVASRDLVWSRDLPCPTPSDHTALTGGEAVVGAVTEVADGFTVRAAGTLSLVTTASVGRAGGFIRVVAQVNATALTLYTQSASGASG